MTYTCTETMSTKSQLLSVNPMKRYRPGQRGFTLIEMMIVGAIISIAVALALPSYSAWYARYQLSSTVREITKDLMLARLAAMNRNRSVTVRVAFASGFVTISGTETSGGAVVFPSKTLPLPVASLTGTPAPSLSTDPITVAFSPLGIRTSPSGTTNQLIAIQNAKGLTYSVKVTPGGNAGWCPASTCT